MGREVRARCGCAVVEAVPRGITRDGRFVCGTEMVVVPCEAGMLHVDLARRCAERVGLDPEVLVAELDRELAEA